ncbi:MAG: hypothetical protein QOD77_986 [Thermoplasmata archaeon]|jgi:hypothetical protein|nr:hypothetical protein [Thermoplasmata archaeon]
MAPTTRPAFALLATALTAFAVTPAADAFNAYNAIAAVDGYDWGCGGIAPTDLSCSDGNRDIGSILDLEVQFCPVTLVSPVHVCPAADQWFQGVVTVKVTTDTGYWSKTCTISVTIPGRSCTEHKGAVYVGQLGTLTGSVQATCGACPAGLPVGYWRAAAYTR